MLLSKSISLQTNTEGRNKQTSATNLAGPLSAGQLRPFPSFQYLRNSMKIKIGLLVSFGVGIIRRQEWGESQTLPICPLMPCVFFLISHTREKEQHRVWVMAPGILVGEKRTARTLGEMLRRITTGHQHAALEASTSRQEEGKQRAHNTWFLNFWGGTNVQLQTWAWAKVKLFFQASQEVAESEKGGNDRGFNKEINCLKSLTGLWCNCTRQ